MHIAQRVSIVIRIVRKRIEKNPRYQRKEKKGKASGLQSVANLFIGKYSKKKILDQRCENPCANFENPPLGTREQLPEAFLSTMMSPTKTDSLIIWTLNCRVVKLSFFWRMLDTAHICSPLQETSIH